MNKFDIGDLVFVARINKTPLSELLGEEQAIKGAVSKIIEDSFTPFYEITDSKYIWREDELEFIEAESAVTEKDILNCFSRRE